MIDRFEMHRRLAFFLFQHNMTFGLNTDEAAATMLWSIGAPLPDELKQLVVYPPMEIEQFKLPEKVVEVLDKDRQSDRELINRMAELYLRSVE